MAIKSFFSSLKTPGIPDNNRLRAGGVFFLLVLAVISVTVCSKSSPLYPLNNWDDANCFYTVGRSAINGQVIYRDVFEQKGPWLYFIYAFASLISGSSFFGAYLIEIASFFLFLFFGARIITLFCDRKAVLLMPVIAVAVASAPAFEQGGSAEELCLPFITYGLYVGLRSMILGKPVSKLEWLFVGITSGAVLWIKFSLLGFYIGCGLFIVLYYIRQKWNRELITFFLMLMAGEAVISLPVFLYFIINGALNELFDVYFYCNIFIYSVRTVDNKLLAVLLNLLEGSKSFLYSFGFGCGIILSGLLYLFFRSKRIFGFVLCSALCSFILIYIGGRRYIYYSLLLAAFTPLGLVFIYKLICAIPKKRFRECRSVNIAFGIALLGYALCADLVWSPNTYMMGFSREDMPQYKFAEIINRTPDATILNYRFLDGGFYTASGVLPSCRFFCGLNIPYATGEQDRYVMSGDTDFIITRDSPMIFDNYEFVAMESFEAHKNDLITYYLYQKKA